MGHHQHVHDNRKKASVGMYSKINVIISTNFICVLFDPTIPTSSFNFIVFIFVMYRIS